jgi:hypothetical protein
MTKNTAVYCSNPTLFKTQLGVRLNSHALESMLGDAQDDLVSYLEDLSGNTRTVNGVTIATVKDNTKLYTVTRVAYNDQVTITGTELELVFSKIANSSLSGLGEHTIPTQNGVPLDNIVIINTGASFKLEPNQLADDYHKLRTGLTGNCYKILD